MRANFLYQWNENCNYLRVIINTFMNKPSWSKTYLGLKLCLWCISKVRDRFRGRRGGRMPRYFFAITCFFVITLRNYIMCLLKLNWSLIMHLWHKFTQILSKHIYHPINCCLADSYFVIIITIIIIIIIIYLFQFGFTNST